MGCEERKVGKRGDNGEGRNSGVIHGRAILVCESQKVHCLPMYSMWLCTSATKGQVCAVSKQIISLSLRFFFSAVGGCYFPLEFQGEFLTQSLTSREIAYTSISVLFDSVGSWGNCHRRLGHHVILRKGGDDGDDDNGGGCFRCLRMVSRSANVLQLHSSSSFDACHPTEEAARRGCPTIQQIARREAVEMMLYKTRSFYGGSAVTRVHCPLNGQFAFTYAVNDGSATSSVTSAAAAAAAAEASAGSDANLECAGPDSESEATDCPTGYKFDLRFKGCSFPDFGEYSINCF